MNIEKILIVESPVKLFRMIESKNEIIDQAENEAYYSIMMFMDSVQEYLNGCKCDREESYEEVIEHYNGSMRKESVIQHLKKAFGCDRIEFKDQE